MSDTPGWSPGSEPWLSRLEALDAVVDAVVDEIMDMDVICCARRQARSTGDGRVWLGPVTRGCMWSWRSSRRLAGW